VGYSNAYYLCSGIFVAIVNLKKPQIIIRNSFGHSHPGSAHLDILVEEAFKGGFEAGGQPDKFFVTDRYVRWRSARS